MFCCSVQLWVEAQRMVLVGSSIGTKGNLGVCKGFIVTFWNCPGFYLKESKLLLILMWKSQNFGQFFPNKHYWKLNCWQRLFFIRSQRQFQITWCLNWACQCWSLGFSNKLGAFSQRPFNLPLASRLPAILLLFQTQKCHNARSKRCLYQM